MDTEPCLCTVTPTDIPGLLNKLAKLDLNTRFGAEDIASAA